MLHYIFTKSILPVLIHYHEKKHYHYLCFQNEETCGIEKFRDYLKISSLMNDEVIAYFYTSSFSYLFGSSK